MIVAEGLRQSFSEAGSDRDVLHGIDLAVGTDEFVAVMGPSGCGKSTLLQLLAGLDVPTSGSVCLGELTISALDEEARAGVRRARIGFVFQQFHLIPSLSVLENVATNAIVSGARPRRWRPRALELLETLGLSALADRRPDRLSGGEQQRVAIARALFHDPDVLLADEPTGSLDSDNGRRVLELFETARRIGRSKSLVMVTHDPAAASVADRVVLMRDGSIVDTIRLDDLEGADRAERVRLRLARAAV